MKIGFRTPNIEKSIKARTTGKIKRKVKSSVNPLYGKKGVGFAKNPEKSVKNAVYHKTTVGVSDVMKKPKKSKKGSSGIITAIIILFIIGGLYTLFGGDKDAPKSSNGITSLTFREEVVELEIGKHTYTESGYVMVKTDTKELTEADVKFISNDESIATIKFTDIIGKYIYYEITPVASGSTTVQAQSPDGVIKSKEITVKVIDKNTP